MHLRPKGIGDVVAVHSLDVIQGPSNALTAERHWRPRGRGSGLGFVGRPSNALTAERHWRLGVG